MSATKLHDAGYHALVSVTPPDAVISPRSNLSLESLGKAPGKLGPDGWHGYAFTTSPASPEQIEEDGANVGLLARDYPGLDIDVEHPTLARLVQQEAVKHLGPAPVRTSREPRRLLVYRATEPFARIACKITYQGEEHTVEMLGDGRQYVVHGTHPSGVEYGWEGLPLWKLPPDELVPVTRESVLSFFRKLETTLAGRATVEIQGDGRSKADLAPPQQELEAPSPEELAACVATIPNSYETRDEYILFGHAVKAAGGPEAEHIFQEWCARWTDGYNDPETVSRDWSRMRGPFRIGWPWLLERAGGNMAQLEFEVDPTATETQAVADGVIPFSDTWVVERLVRWLRGTTRYLPESGRWHLWGSG